MDGEKPYGLIERQVETEWLLANRQGGFAMGCPDRAPRRKYHGLLTVRTPQYDDPHHVLAEVGEALSIGERVYELGVFHYVDAISPNGHELLQEFKPEPFPVWTYRCGDALVVRRLRMHDYANAVRLEYEISGVPPGSRFSLFPYFTCRNAHDLQSENPSLDGRPLRKGSQVLFRFYNGFPEIFIKAPEGGSFETEGFWNRRVAYFEELARGYGFLEDLFCPGAFHQSLDQRTVLAFEVGLTEEGDPGRFTPPEDEAERSDNFVARLERAADAFLIQPGPHYASAIAGYPWFGEWGRDVFISLDGLTLARGRLDPAARMLATFSSRLRKGLVPNVLSKTPEHSDTNSVDASLWFIRAVQRLEAVAGADRVASFEDTVFDILEAMRSHKHRGIHVRPSGLLYASSMPKPLTWMDAFVDGQAVTPRSPFAVEVNALFYNAIMYGLKVAARRGDQDFDESWRPLAAALKKLFIEAFWLPEGQYLADAHSGFDPDLSFRPNQLIALALPYRMIAKAQGRAILKQVRARLLTPFGLRSLDPDDPRYRPRCEGDVQARDLAYHQGSVWPWLLGPYIDATLNIEGKAAAKREIIRVLEPFRAHLDDACLGQVSEIFDGDPPHAPRGAPAQAWSVAELLRIAALGRELGLDP